MATLICNYLRAQGVAVDVCSVYDGYWTLYERKPKLFFLVNPTGAIENYEMMLYARARGCLGVSLVSEGIYFGGDDYLDQMIWGWNKEKVLYENIQLQWSNRTRDITISYHSDLDGRIAVSGGVGFDNYTISKVRRNKREFLSKYGKEQYDKTIGVGCFDFDVFYPHDPRFKLIERTYSQEVIERFRQDGRDFDNHLAALAQARPDILFIVKLHPGGETDHHGAAVTGMKGLPNTLFLKDEEPLIDCISASDIWVVYESTTALEASLLGKQACLLNPSGRDFPRTVVNEGYPVFQSDKDLSAAIDEFYATGALSGFVQLDSSRRSIVEKTIGWDDGLNHVRAGNVIIDLLKSSPALTWRREAISEAFDRWKQHVKWLVGPFIRRYDRFLNSAANRHRFSMKDLQMYQQTKMLEQQAFYARKGLSLDDLRQIKCTK